MRTASCLARHCLRLRQVSPQARALKSHGKHFSKLPPRSRTYPSTGCHTRGKTALWAVSALTPAVFIQLSEEDCGDGKTPEQHMLEASRAEIRKRVPDDYHGLRRALTGFYLFLDKFIYEPIATGFRFLHLLIIFVPVIATTPVVWFGGRRKDRDNERSGTLWWYGFLVRSMERAGPAFIKVPRSSCYHTLPKANQTF